MNASKKIMNQGKKEETISTSSAPKTNSKVKLGGASDGPGMKTYVLGGFCVALILILCIGVGIQQFKPSTVLKIDGEKITMDDMMYPIYERESKYLPSNEIYESYLGTSIWDAGYMGTDSTVDSNVTNAEGLKQEIINAETEYAVLYNEAVKAKYKLTKDEEKDARSQAKKAVKGLSFVQKLQLNISEKKLSKRFEKRILADRYKADQKKTTDATVNEKDAIKNVSKKDLRQYDVQYYSFAKKSTDSSTGTETKLTDKQIKEYTKKLNELAVKAKTAKDFTKLLGSEKESGVTYNSGNFTEKEGWSTYLSDANLKKIKKMKNGEISGVITDSSTGYTMLIKMVNNNSNKSYDSACDEAITSAKQTAYNAWLAKLEKKHQIKTYDSGGTDVKIGTVTTSIVTADDLSKMAEADSSSSESK